jgi:hypothetical protein
VGIAAKKEQWGRQWAAPPPSSCGPLIHLTTAAVERKDGVGVGFRFKGSRTHLVTRIVSAMIL